MLGATMASVSDGCIGEQRDPCASPPCKRLRQVLPVECIVIEDSNESTTEPLTNQDSHPEVSTLLPDLATTSENQAIESLSHTKQCVGNTNSDVVSMETESFECQFEHNSEAKPSLPVMVDLTSETKTDIESISVNNSNSTMLNGNGVFNSNMNAEPNSDKKCLPSSTPPPRGKDGITLFEFFKPVTPGSKSASVENLKKTPLKNDGKTALKSSDGDVVGSSCAPGNTSPNAVGMTKNKTTPSPTPATSIEKTTTPRQKTPGRKLSVEEKLKREEERIRRQKEKEALEKERLEKKKEKERLKEEKLKEKMEAKQKKEHERSEQLEMKKQRERERIEKKEQEEEERKERLEKKGAERKKKENEKNLKNEEKRRKEEEEMQKKQKAMNSFAKFFIKKEISAPPKPKEQAAKQAKFQPFELKPFMKLASTPYRKPLSDNDREKLSKTIVEQSTTSLRHVKAELVALGEIARDIKQEDEQTKICRAQDQSDEDIMIINDDVCSDTEIQEDLTKQELNEVKRKLLQFHENYRPAYFGSWRKKSYSVGPRRPFKKDEGIMNYEVDSDEEWEEEEPGESLSNSECEDEDESCPNEDEDDQDGFFVPHGYLSDDEGDVDGKDDVMEHDGDKVSQLNSDDKMERHLAKQKTWEAELKRQFKPMKPVAVGCVWEEEIPAILKKLEACCMLVVDSIDPTSARKEYQEKAVNSSPTIPATYCNTAMPVPEEAMPFLIKMLHGSEAGLKKLANAFRKRWTLETNKADSRVSEETWESHCTVSKRQVEKKMTAIASKEIRASMPKPRWYVASKILASYEMENIDLPTNGLSPTIFVRNKKSASPASFLQTKSPLTSLTSTKDASVAKINGIVEEKTSENIEVVSMDTAPPVRLE